MTAVNEWIVREYFEANGYLVIQPRKYVVPGRQKKAEEEIDIIVHNPKVTDSVIPDHLVWTSRDLKNVAGAVVGVRGWHTERFYVSTFEQSPDILKFSEAASMGFASKILGTDSIAKILCLPKLPASGELKKNTIKVLKDKGIDGVISFRTMLAELIDKTDVNKNYEKSDLLQIIRLLKNYDFIRDDQLDLFTRKSRRKPKTSSGSGQ